MSTIDENLASLSDEAKIVAFWLFRDRASPVPVLSTAEGFFGPAYEAALEELKLAGILEETVERTPYMACYNVHHDLSSLVWWFVKQTKDRRDQLLISMQRRVPDNRPIAKVARKLDVTISAIESYRLSDQTDYKPLVDVVENLLKDLRLEIVGPKIGPEIAKARRFDVEPQWHLEDDLKTKDVKSLLGGLKGVEGGDDGKSKIEWYFTVDGEKASIWDWKGAWCAFGARETFEKLGFKSISKW
jgi:hypothetical protein